MSYPKSVKSPSNSVRYSCEKICSWLRRPKTILEIRKKATFLYVINNPIIYKFFKNSTNHRKKNNRVLVFSCRPLMKRSNNQENKTSYDTYWRVQLICMKVPAYNSLEPPLEYNQDQMPGIQSGPDAFDQSRFIMTFLTILRVTEIFLRLT